MCACCVSVSSPTANHARRAAGVHGWGSADPAIAGDVGPWCPTPCRAARSNRDRRVHRAFAVADRGPAERARRLGPDGSSRCCSGCWWRGRGPAWPSGGGRAGGLPRPHAVGSWWMGRPPPPAARSRGHAWRHGVAGGRAGRTHHGARCGVAVSGAGWNWLGPGAWLALPLFAGRAVVRRPQPGPSPRPRAVRWHRDHGDVRPPSWSPAELVGPVWAIGVWLILAADARRARSRSCGPRSLDCTGGRRRSRQATPSRPPGWLPSDRRRTGVEWPVMLGAGAVGLLAGPARVGEADRTAGQAARVGAARLGARDRCRFGDRSARVGVAMLSLGGPP